MTQTRDTGEETWGPWIQHDGRGCPVPAGTIVCTRDRIGNFDGPFPALFLLRDGTLLSTPAEASITCWTWARDWQVPDWDIVEYRVRKPKGLIILEEILREVEETTPLRKGADQERHVRIPATTGGER